MPKPKPDCSIQITFRSGKRYRIDLFWKYAYEARNMFSIRFTDDNGDRKEGSGTISRVTDRMRRLLVQELRR